MPCNLGGTAIWIAGNQKEIRQGGGGKNKKKKQTGTWGRKKVGKKKKQIKGERQTDQVKVKSQRKKRNPNCFLKPRGHTLGATSGRMVWKEGNSA